MKCSLYFNFSYKPVAPINPVCLNDIFCLGCDGCDEKGCWVKVELVRQTNGSLPSEKRWALVLATVLLLISDATSAAHGLPS